HPPSETGLASRELRALFESQALATSGAQRRFYGEKRWYRKFIRLEEVEKRYGRETVRDVWRALPQSRFKRFQELFCHPLDRIVPRFSIEPGKIVFSQDPNTLSLAPVLVHPSRIPNSLVKSLGLFTVAKGRGCGVVNQMRKSSLETVNRLKLIWECAELLEAKNGRVFCLTDPTDAVKSRYPVSGDLSSLKGGILVVREVGRESVGGEDIRRLSVQFFRTGHSALRRVIYAHEGYCREAAALEGAIASLVYAEDVLRRHYRKEMPSEEKERIRSEVKNIFRSAFDVLRASIDRHKVEARELIGWLATLRDQLGRTNIWAGILKVKGALKRVHRRLWEMRAKGSYLWRDLKALQSEIGITKRALKAYAGRIRNAAEVLGSDLSLFKENISQRQRDGQVKGVLARCKIDPESLPGMRVAPYATAKEKLSREYGRLVDALYEGSREKSHESLVRMYMIVKFCAVFELFERMKVDIFLGLISLRNGTTSPAGILFDLKRKNRALRRAYNERRVIPSHTISDEYAEPFSALKKGLEDVEKGLDFYVRRNPSPEEAQQILKNFKRYLEKFDIGEILASLP
ncbi:MAG: hypothetical protein D6808_06905, partial [Candidatus Dadabacteria bacterium]